MYQLNFPISTSPYHLINIKSRFLLKCSKWSREDGGRQKHWSKWCLTVIFPFLLLLSLYSTRTDSVFHYLKPVRCLSCYYSVTDQLWVRRSMTRSILVTNSSSLHTVDQELHYLRSEFWRKILQNCQNSHLIYFSLTDNQTTSCTLLSWLSDYLL